MGQYDGEYKAAHIHSDTGGVNHNFLFQMYQLVRKGGRSKEKLRGRRI